MHVGHPEAPFPRFQTCESVKQPLRPATLPVPVPLPLETWELLSSHEMLMIQRLRGHIPVSPGTPYPLLWLLKGDEPVPCEIDARARGRVATIGWNVGQHSGDALSDDVSKWRS